ncbi:molybdenum cofactor biosynthesis protein MoaE [Chloroflexota bacterium]
MIKITDKDFSVEEVLEKMRRPEVGGIITYLGTVRSFSEGGEVKSVEFAADGAAVAELEEVERKALEEFDVTEVAIVQRIGRLKVGEKILLVAVSAAHRQPAFAACMSIIDWIKEIHSGWQQEVYRTG